MKAFNSGRHPTKINSKRVKAYEVWRHLMMRCGYLNKPPKRRYTQEDVSVHHTWLDYSNFYEDVTKMHGYDVDDFVLDKDILSGKKKVYSASTCCFVPDEINAIFTKSDSTRGNYLIGVDFHKKTGKFRARCRKHLGLFDSEYEAFLAYKYEKERLIKELADKWKGVIDAKVYQALINYQVEITD